MKKLIAILLLAVLCLSLVSCAASDGTPEGMQNVSTEDAMFNLYVPASWVSRTASGIPGACVSSADGSNVFAFAKMLDNVATAESYWTDTCKPLYEADLADFAELPLAENTTVSLEEPVVLGGKNAVKKVISFTQGGETFKGMIVIAVLDDTRAYHFCYFAKAENFLTHLEEVESEILPEFTFR